MVLGLTDDENCSHLIGCVYVDAILNVFQGLVQVARTGGSEKTVSCICLQPRENEGQKEKRGREGRKKRKGARKGKECTASREVEKETEALD